MDDLKRESADAILRTLYNLKPNEMEEFWIVCESNGIPKDEGERLYQYLDAKGLLKVMGKVGNGDVYITLSKDGIKFFAEDNLVNEYRRLYKQTEQPPTTFNIAGNASNFGNNNVGHVTNTSTHTNTTEPELEKWYSKFLHDTGTQIVSGLAVAGIIALLTWYFSQ